MRGTGTRGVPGASMAALCLVLGASGCFPMPPPLMYPATPVPAGHFRFGGALAGSIDMPGRLGANTPSPLPGGQLSARYGLGHGASLGLSVSGGPDLMLDGRFEVLRTPRLSLSVGAELGAVGAPVSHIAVSCAFHVACNTGGGGPPVAPIADVPVVLGLSYGRATIWLGVRPGLLVLDPLAGGLVGASIPVEHLGAVDLQLDVSHSFMHLDGIPDTVVTVAVGLSH